MNLLDSKSRTGSPKTRGGFVMQRKRLWYGLLGLVGSSPIGPVEDFATGWLNSDTSSDGRPVDVTVGADGALYVRDDKGGFIY
jgi:glucose/arabinose dehydrogenase